MACISGKQEEWGTRRNRRETQASVSCHLALSHVPEPREGTLSVRHASGPVAWFQGPRAVSSELLHSGQWRLPTPSSPGTWFCGWVEVACWSLSWRASLSCMAASSSCSRAFSSCSWDMASTILCTMGAAPGGPPRLEHLPLPKSRPPMSKVVANQQDGEDPPWLKCWARRGGADHRGWGGDASQWDRGQGQQQQGGGEPGAPGPAREEATSVSIFCETELPGSGLRKATFTLHPSEHVP